MNNNKGITMISLAISIVVLLILASVSIGIGNNVIKQSNLENLKTNMLLIKSKAKEYVENANFSIGATIDTVEVEEKNNRINNAKEKLKGTEITDKNEISNIENNVESNEYIFYYKISTQELNDIGLNNVKSDEKNGFYIIKYDIKNIEVEIYNTKGFKDEDKTYYSLTDIQNLNI